MTREEQQDLLAQAIHYIQEKGDIEQGVVYLRQAAEAGMPEAMSFYAEYWDTEKKDAATAVDWYEKCYRSGYPLELKEEYRSGSDEFRAAIDARFSAEDKERMGIRSQKIYDLQVRLFMLLFCCGIGAKIGQLFDLEYAVYIGLALGLGVAICLWKHVTYAQLAAIGKKK